MFRESFRSARSSIVVPNCLAVLIVWTSIGDRVLGGIPLTIDATQSYLTMTGELAGFPFTEQASNSLTTTLSGIMDVGIDVGLDSIHFHLSSNILTQDQIGTFEPDGTTATLAGEAGVGGQALVHASISDWSLNAFSGNRTISNGEFSPQGIYFDSTAGEFRLAYVGAATNSRSMLAFGFFNTTLSNATIETTSSGTSIRLPIEGDIQLGNGRFLQTVDAHFQGQIVAHGPAVAAPPPNLTIVPLQANDLVYDERSGKLYASVSSSNTTSSGLIPIDPHTGVAGDLIPIEGNPEDLVVSTNGQYVYARTNAARTVQRLDVDSGVVDTAVDLPVGQAAWSLEFVPGTLDSLMFTIAMPQFSTPSIRTVVYSGGIELPQHVGDGLGLSSITVSTVDETGTLGYGYDNKTTGFTFTTLQLDDEGVHATGVYPGGSVLTGFGIRRLAAAGGKIFDDQGHVLDATTLQLIGAFLGSGNFTIDPAANMLFSLDDSNHDFATLRAYDLETLDLIAETSLPGIFGPLRDTTFEPNHDLTRFGTNGLAFRDGVGNIMLYEWSAIPETGSFMLLMSSGISLLAYARWRGSPWRVRT